MAPGSNVDLSNPVKKDEWARSNGFTGWNDYQDNVRSQGVSGGGASAVTDPIALAKQAQQMQIQANQPAIATLNTQKSTLDTKYDDLLKSIDSSQGVALDKTTLATNNELGKRGITSDSGVAQQQQAAAALPVTTQFGQLKANTGLQRENDLTALAAKIAELQAGNVPSSLNFATGVGSLQNQAQSIANSFILGERSADQQQQQIDAAKKLIPIGASGLYDPATGKVIQGIDAIKSGVNNNAGW